VDVIGALMKINWQLLFVPQTPIIELVTRGIVMYVALFVLIRVVIRRHVGIVNIMDLLVIVLIADAAQNGMAGEYRSITEGIVLCGVIIGMSYCLDWLAYYFPKLRPWLEPPTLPLIRHGRMIRRNMRQELISEDELMTKLREQGISDMHEVKLAYIESDGQFSVIRASNQDANPAS